MSQGARQQGSSGTNLVTAAIANVSEPAFWDTRPPSLCARRSLEISLPIGDGFRGSVPRLVECLCWPLPAEGLSRTSVEFGGYVVDFGLGDVAKAAVAWEVLAQQSVGVLVGVDPVRWTP